MLIILGAVTRSHPCSESSAQTESPPLPNCEPKRTFNRYANAPSRVHLSFSMFILIVIRIRLPFPLHCTQHSYSCPNRILSSPPFHNITTLPSEHNVKTTRERPARGRESAPTRLHLRPFRPKHSRDGCRVLVSRPLRLCLSGWDTNPANSFCH